MDIGKVAVFTTISILLIAAALAAAPSYANPLSNEGVETSGKNPTTLNGFLPDDTPPPTQWNRTYGGTGWDVANSAIETSDGGYMLAGYTESYGAGGGDFWLVRTNSAGRVLWNRTYGGQEYDEAQSIIQTVDGGYAIAGVTRSYGLGVTDFWLVKTDSNGNHQWNRTYGGANYDYLFSAIRTSDDGFALVGYTESYGQGGDFWLVKTDSNGIMQWNETYGGNGWEEAHAVAQTGDGGYAIVGETDSVGAGGTDMWWVKTASDGRKQRDKPYGGVNNDGASSLLQTSDGGYAIAGYTESFGYGMPLTPDFYLVKIDSSGRQSWDKPYGGLFVDSAESLVSIEGGGFALAGATQLYSNASDQDFCLITTDASGNLNWSQTYGGQGYDHPFSEIRTGDGGFALAGDTFSYGNGSGDMWLVKVEGSVPLHDLAVIDVIPSKTVVGQGFSLSVNVTVENQGNRLEIFNTTMYANTTAIEAIEATLTSGTSATVTFTWDTTGVVKHHYTISAYAWPVPAETDTADNNFVDGTVQVTIAGDINGDDIVDVLDLATVGKAYGTTIGQALYNSNADINSDGTTDVIDLAIAGKNYGKADS